MGSIPEKIKTFTELLDLDLKGHTNKRPTYKRAANGQLEVRPVEEHLDYLPWAKCLILMYENGAQKVRYGTEVSQDGYPAFYFQNTNPFVKVWVDVDGERNEIFYPVIDGEVFNQYPNQMTIHKAQQRAFVKCVAINWGLGLRLWLSEERENAQKVEETNRARNKTLDEQILSRFAELVKQVESDVRVHEILGTTKKTFTNLTSSDNIAAKEEMLKHMNEIQWSEKGSTGAAT